MGPMGTYKMLTKDGDAFCGLMKTAGTDMANVPTHWAIYISTPNVDETVAKAQEMGAKLMVPAMDVPTIGRMALLQDPQGATFWVFTGARSE